MISAKQVNDMLKTVTFKDWRFHAYDHVEGVALVIQFSVPNSEEDGMQEQNVWSIVPPHVNFYDWLFWRLKRIMIHEVGEFYRINGNKYWDPHASFERQLRLFHDD